LPTFSAIGAIGPPIDVPPPVSDELPSYQRERDVKLTISSIFLSAVSRVLSTNRYNGDRSSCRFYIYIEKRRDDEQKSNQLTGTC